MKIDIWDLKDEDLKEILESVPRPYVLSKKGNTIYKNGKPFVTLI